MRVAADGPKQPSVSLGRTLHNVYVFTQ